MINNAALVALRDVENNGRKGTPPPLVARAMYWVSVAVAEAWALPGGAEVARSVAAQVMHGLLGTTVQGGGRAQKGSPPGAHIVEQILARAAVDGAAQAHAPRAFDQTQRPVWTAKDAKGQTITPLLPSFGRVVHAVAANASVRALALELSDDQWRAWFAAHTVGPDEVACANFWADGPGSFTPPGHWNTIATDVIALVGLDNARGARVLAALNAALHDAGVSCWDTKYQYGGERPFQAAARLGIAFTPVVNTPPFPGYTSGHATFSAAAAAVLGRCVDAEGKAAAVRERLVTHAKLPATKESIRNAPDATTMFAALAAEAAHSRVVGGIHIDVDGTAGLSVGQAIGANAWDAYFARTHDNDSNA
jgi:membrane-associated phospholipid phosphatase